MTGRQAHPVDEYIAIEDHDRGLVRRDLFGHGSAAACGAEIPDETAGPYPGDGSNGPNVLAESGIVRSDITSSFGSSTTKARAYRRKSP